MTADNTGSSQFYEQKRIGSSGEKNVKEALEGRQHWQATLEADSIINSEKIFCKAQVWEPRADDHQANLDFMVKVKPCKECEITDCEYKHLEPYPEAVCESHEVKTNPATHTKEARDMLKDDGKRFVPSGNLFIETWQNVKLEKGKTHTPGNKYPGKEGWFFKEPLAAWYHFYQPRHTKKIQKNGQVKYTDTTEPEVYKQKGEKKEEYNKRVQEYQAKLEQDKKRFEHEMTTNDRLIIKRPWAYTVSIRGDKLEEIVNDTCIRDDENQLHEQVVYNENKTISIGYLLPLTELLNNPLFYDRYGKGFVSFTHHPCTTKGTRPAEGKKITYYMPETMYENIFEPKTQPKGTIKIPENSEELVKFLNEAFITAPHFIVKIGNTWLVNAWAVLEPNDRIIIFSRITGSEYTKLYAIPEGKTIVFTTSGTGLNPFGDTYIKASWEEILNQFGVPSYGPVYKRFDLVPIIVLLNDVKKQPASIDTQ